MRELIRLEEYMKSSNSDGRKAWASIENFRGVARRKITVRTIFPDIHIFYAAVSIG